MNYLNNKVYVKDLEKAMELTVDIDYLKDQKIMITGATGLLGSFMVDMLLTYNKKKDANIKVYAVGRSMTRLMERFGAETSSNLIFVEHDVTNDIVFDYHVDYLIHAASNAYPESFNSDPVGTIMSNIVGTQKLLDYCRSHNAKRFMLVSSGEIYGIGDVSTEAYTEDYSGYINPTLPRSCYPSSKRAAETLCASYLKQYGVDTVVVRPCHTYGPNATVKDDRAHVQFVNQALNGQDIVLTSAGSQLRSYCYIADSVSAIFTVLIHGISGEAYNISNSKSRVTIAEFATIVAERGGKRIIFTNPTAKEMEERTPITQQVLDSTKLEKLGWKGYYSVKCGINHIFEILGKQQLTDDVQD